MKASWVWQGDVRKFVWRNEAKMKKGKGQQRQFLCITDGNTRFKNTRIAKKTALFVIIKKQNNRRIKTTQIRETQMKNTEIVKTSTTENQSVQNESNLGLKRGCQGNVFQGNKQKLRKDRATKKW